MGDEISNTTQLQVLRTLDAMNTCIADAISSVDSAVGTWSEVPFMRESLALVHRILLHIGVSNENLPSHRTLLYSFIVLCCIALFSLVNKIRSERRQRLNRELQEAQEKLRYLQDKLRRCDPTPSSSSSTPRGAENEVRIFMDGAFDLLHYGHMNAFRLGRSLGTHLIVGLNSDESITKCKGAPLMNDEERLTMVSACKFVDEVVPDCPYIMSKKYLDFVIEKYKIDYVIHGDDPCIVDGKDVYATAKETGKFRSIPRTEGVSTTDIVGRMLVMTKEHHYHEVVNDDGHHDDSDDDESTASKATTASNSSSEKPANTIQALSQQSKFGTTSRMLKLFSAGLKEPKAGMKVVYIDGAWDLFHPGHVAILKAARERGDYLMVGIHGDAIVNKVQGMNLPLMNLKERVLSLLGCRHVDDVVIDAPYVITREMMDSLRISEVVRVGRNQDDIGFYAKDQEARFRHVKKRGILTVMDSPTSFSLESIVSRIHRNQETFQAKFERKISIEREFYKETRSTIESGHKPHEQETAS